MTNITDKTYLSLKLTISLVAGAILITGFLLDLSGRVKRNNELIANNNDLITCLQTDVKELTRVVNAQNQISREVHSFREILK